MPIIVQIIVAIIIVLFPIIFAVSALFASGEIDTNDVRNIFSIFKPKHKLQRKVEREIRKIEKQINERKKLEKLYDKRDKLLKQLEEDE